jgi:hypothetical protein
MTPPDTSGGPHATGFQKKEEKKRNNNLWRTGLKSLNLSLLLGDGRVANSEQEI